MISSRDFVALLVSVVGVLALSSAEAHRLPVTVTTINVLDGGQVEITHRVHAHDAISVLSLDPDIIQPEVTSLRARAKIALYASEHFLLGIKRTGSEPTPITMEILGAELDGDYLYIYQQAIIPVPKANLYLRSDLLSNIGNDWLSHVNLEAKGKVHTVTFSGKPRWKKAPL